LKRRNKANARNKCITFGIANCGEQRTGQIVVESEGGEVAKAESPRFDRASKAVSPPRKAGGCAEENRE
jgi:hypothetical protein